MPLGHQIAVCLRGYAKLGQISRIGAQTRGHHNDAVGIGPANGCGYTLDHLIEPVGLLVECVGALDEQVK